MISKILRNPKSITYTIRAMINEATATTIELPWSSFQLGQDTLFNRSSADSLMYSTNFAITIIFI